MQANGSGGAHPSIRSGSRKALAGMVTSSLGASPISFGWVCGVLESSWGAGAGIGSSRQLAWASGIISISDEIVQPPTDAHPQQTLAVIWITIRDGNWLDFQMDTGQTWSFVSTSGKQRSPCPSINFRRKINSFTLFNNWQFRKFFCSHAANLIAPWSRGYGSTERCRGSPLHLLGWFLLWKTWYNIVQQLSWKVIPVSTLAEKLVRIPKLRSKAVRLTCWVWASAINNTLARTGCVGREVLHDSPVKVGVEVTLDTN